MISTRARLALSTATAGLLGAAGCSGVGPEASASGGDGDGVSEEALDREREAHDEDSLDGRLRQ